jgi:hypothetical protein
LGSAIDPNVHSCGTVPPHGHKELSHPEPGYYAVGIKSYGRAPTFLMATGYEQVRSVAADLAGDVTAANDIRLVLPETGVCSTHFAAEDDTQGACSSGDIAAATDACCKDNALTKAAGDDGCGSAGARAMAATVVQSCGCEDAPDAPQHDDRAPAL